MSAILIFLIQSMLLEQSAVMPMDFLSGGVTIQLILESTMKNTIFHAVAWVGAVRAVACNGGMFCGEKS